MFEKKKLNFWRLAYFFIGLSAIVLFLLWSKPYEAPAQMMGSSMGNMMKDMHVTSSTIYDLFTKSENSSQMNEMHKHHQEQSPIVYKMNFLSTAIIFLLLPFIIGGAIILTIVWMR